MTKKAKKYARDYYREKRQNDNGEYAAYMKEYMRQYRAKNPEYVAHEREYHKTYVRSQKLIRLKQERNEI